MAAKKEFLNRTKPVLKPHYSKPRFGFTGECSSAKFSFIVSESVRETRDTHQPLLITMIDPRKAFDVV